MEMETIINKNGLMKSSSKKTSKEAAAVVKPNCISQIYLAQAKPKLHSVGKKHGEIR